MSSDGLVVSDVAVSYGDVRAVDGVDLVIERGRITALLGPSGCGKSTLLRAIAGLEDLAGGSISWLGRDLAGVPVHQRGIGLMFQDHALFPHRNVADNVGFGLKMAGLPAAARRDRVDELLELVGLAGMGERTIGTLSGGQAQRVALARALAPEPQLLLLDEPLGSLDRQLRDRLVAEIRSIATHLGVTALHVTHDHDEAIAVADDIALMEHGRIRRAGTVDELLTDPGDPATAAALQIDTVWELPVADGSAHTLFGSVDATGDTIRALLPPDAVRVTSPGVAVTVVGARRRGSGWLLDCVAADGTVVAAAHDVRVDAGTEVALSAELGQLRLLG